MSHGRFVVALAAALVLGAASGFGEGPPAEQRATQSVSIVLEAPKDERLDKGAEIQVRVFEGEDPDAPPQVTALAGKSQSVEALAFPFAMEIEVPVARLAAALRPAVAVVVTSGGSMVYWNAEQAPLSRVGATIVRLERVP